MIDELIQSFSGPILAIVGPFFFLLLCAFGLPVPEDVILIVAGLLGEKFGYPFYLISAVTYFGIVIGDGIIFLMGAKWGHRLLRTRIGRFLFKESTINKAEAALARYGSWVIFAARFLPGLRTAVFFSSGTLGFSFWRFLLMDGFAALISAPLFVFVGKATWRLYESNSVEFDEVIAKIQNYAVVGTVAIVGLIVGYFVIKRLLRGRW